MSSSHGVEDGAAAAFDELGRRPIDPDEAASWVANGWWPTTTIVDDFRAVVAATPDRPAIVTYRQGRDLPVTFTYGQLGILVDRFAAALVDFGIEPGDVVSLQLPNSWEFPALTLAILQVGAVVNPLVPIFRHRELAFILERTEAKLLVVPRTFRGFDHGELAARLVAEVPTLQAAFVVDGDAPEGTKSFHDHFVARRWEDTPNLRATLAARAPAPDDLCEIQFTSGTTGEPKGVLHDHRTAWASGRAITGTLGVGPDDVCFMASTLAHQTGFLFGFASPLGLGTKVVYQDVWDAKAAIRIFDAERVAYTVSATPFVVDLIDAQQEIHGSLASFKYFICGGAPIPPHVVAAAAETLDAELVAVWGMTENGVVTATRPGSPIEVVANSDGIPMPWMQLRIVDDEGVELPLGETGHLQVRGPNQTLGYFRRPDTYLASSSADGWFDTGDLAWRRDDGGIRISGRAKDLVIRGGENVPVVEIEALLYTHPKVRELAVIGLPDDRLGERACAVVVPSDESAPPTLAELVGALDAAGVAKQYWPERLEVVAEMPRTPSGKIQKYQLRDRFSGS